jgi:tetratricopeptide (TPR) repeat protein
MEEEGELVTLSIEFFGKALLLDSGYLSSMFHQGLMYRRKADFTNALKMFTRVMQKLPQDQTVFIERGLVYKDMGNHEHAIVDFIKAIEIDENSTLAYFHMGISKLKLGQISEAIVDLKEADKKDTMTVIPGISDGLG